MKAPTPKPRHVKRDQSAQDIADLQGTNEKTVRNWAGEGCPHSKDVRGKYSFNDAEVQAWLDAQGKTGKPGRPPKPKFGDDDDSEEKDYWLARKYRIQSLREEGLVVDRASYKAEWIGRIGAAKNKLIGMPAQIAPSLVGQDAGDIEHALRDRVEQIIREIQVGD